MSQGAWRDPVGRSRQRPGLPGSKIHCELFKNNSGPDENHWSGTVKFVLYFIRMTLGIPSGASGEDAGHLRGAGSTPGLGEPLGRACGPTAALLPGEPHGQRSLVGYSPWGHRVRND